MFCSREQFDGFYLFEGISQYKCSNLAAQSKSLKIAFCCTPKILIVLYVCCPPIIDISQRCIKITQSLVFNPIRHTIGGLCNAASDCCKRVAVASERNGVSDCVLKVRAFKECDDRLWHRILTAFIEAVGWTNFIKGLG